MLPSAVKMSNTSSKSHKVLNRMFILDSGFPFLIDMMKQPYKLLNLQSLCTSVCPPLIYGLVLQSTNTRNNVLKAVLNKDRQNWEFGMFINGNAISPTVHCMFASSYFGTWNSPQSTVRPH